MSIHYHDSYTVADIERYLLVVKECVKSGDITISLGKNRAENVSFFREYRLDRIMACKILDDLEPKDFCYTLQNLHTDYEHETLHVFSPTLLLVNRFGENVTLEVYIKLNLIERKRGKHCTVISMHTCNKPIRRPFAGISQRRN